MEAIIFTVLVFFSTILGGLASIKFKKHLRLILSFTAGVIFGLVAFDILPEIFEIARKINTNPKEAMIALVAGFMFFHLLEKFFIVHKVQEGKYSHHSHPTTGVYSALALTAHSFLDGVGIGLGFQLSNEVGILVAIAVIGHVFADGLNTGALMLLSKNTDQKTIRMIFLNAVAPIIGAISTLFFTLSESSLIIYLGLFAGFLLYIALEDILPEAHSEKAALPILMTFVGLILIYLITGVI